jgi:hypothetical protein
VVVSKESRLWKSRDCHRFISLLQVLGYTSSNLDEQHYEEDHVQRYRWVARNIGRHNFLDVDTVFRRQGRYRYY